MKNTGIYFRSLREEKGISQGVLGQELGYKYKAGGQFISNFERGLSVFPYVQIHRAIDFLASDDFERFDITRRVEELLTKDMIEKFRGAKSKNLNP